MSGKLQKSQIPIRHSTSLPDEAQKALAECKKQLGKGKVFKNEQNALRTPQQGYEYREFDAGHARPEDPKSKRGTWRLVFEVHSKSKREKPSILPNNITGRAASSRFGHEML